MTICSFRQFVPDGQNAMFAAVSPRRTFVLFLTPYPPGVAPSQRFRFEQYFDELRARKIEVSVQPFLSYSSWKTIYSKGGHAKKVLAVVLGFCRRMAGLLDAARADFVFVHREASPLGPPIFEWTLAKVLGKKIIYDFDDAIWLTDRASETRIARVLKWRQKVPVVCRLAYRVSAGNEYLCAFARNYCKRVVLNPTTIDINHHQISKAHPARQSGLLTIGWTGTHSTLKYLELLAPVLRQIGHKYPFVDFVVISDVAPNFKLDRLRYIPWNLKHEIRDLSSIDIGVMPLPDDEWSKGKCGFKILQYMALRIPSVCSRVGANIEIVRHGENGFLCATEEEWLHHLSALIESEPLRSTLGDKGYYTVLERYSVDSNARTFLSLFE